MIQTFHRNVVLLRATILLTGTSAWLQCFSAFIVTEVHVIGWEFVNLIDSGIDASHYSTDACFIVERMCHVRAFGAPLAVRMKIRENIRARPDIPRGQMLIMDTGHVSHRLDTPNGYLGTHHNTDVRTFWPVAVQKFPQCLRTLRVC